MARTPISFPGPSKSFMWTFWIIEKIRQLLSALAVFSLLFPFFSTSLYIQCFSKCVPLPPASKSLECFLKMGDTQHHHCATGSGCRELGPGICMVHISTWWFFSALLNLWITATGLIPGCCEEESWLISTEDWLIFSQDHFLSLCYIVTFKSVHSYSSFSNKSFCSGSFHCNIDEIL